MSNSHYWTDERKQAQRDRINQTKPWLKSTGAKTLEGKAKVSRNAYKGGLWLRMAELNKKVNTVLREQKNILEQR